MKTRLKPLEWQALMKRYLIVQWFCGTNGILNPSLPLRYPFVDARSKPLGWMKIPLREYKPLEYRNRISASASANSLFARLPYSTPSCFIMKTSKPLMAVVLSIVGSAKATLPPPLTSVFLIPDFWQKVDFSGSLGHARDFLLLYI